MEEYAKPRTGRERLSYWKIGLTTTAATQELLSGMLLVLFIKKRTHPPMEQHITLTGTTQCQTVQTHTPHRLQEDPPFNEPVA